MFRAVLLVAVAIELMLIPFMLYLKEYRVNEYLETKTISYDHNFNAAVSNYQTYSDFIVENYIKTPEIMDLFSRVKDADKKEKDELRNKIYNSLKEDYKKYISFGFKQLHFHLPDQESFIRMHRPEKYGDNLRLIRYSILKAANEKKMVTGFEEGRIYNGYRFVYPLFYKNEFIGTVELSVSAQALMKLMNDMYNKRHNFIIKKEVILKKVFSEELINYKKSCYDDYMKEGDSQLLVSVYENVESKFCKHVDLHLKEIVADKMRQNKEFSVSYTVEGTPFIISYMPIKNVAGDYVAYMIRYDIDNKTAELKEKYNYFIILFSLIIFLSSLTYYMLKRNKNDKDTIEFLLREQIAESEIRMNAQEEMIVQQAKLAAAGETMNIVAHEWKQPLNALGLILQCMQSAYEDAGKENPFEIEIETCMKQIDHMDKVTKDFMNFVRPDENSNSRASLRDCINYSVSVVAAHIRKRNIKIEIVEAPEDFDTIHVKSTKSELELVLMNLLQNAKDAVIDQQNLVGESYEGQIRIFVKREMDGIILEIRDNGVGIDEDVAKQIFEQYFTTKGKSGTGIGLYVSKLVIENRVGGKISVESLPDGTMFRLVLPIL